MAADRPVPDDRDVAARVAAHDQWYHTLELAPGVTTPGWYDLRPVIDRVPFPDDLSGRRCLDVATFDGFWAFAMEARGADEVVAIDLLDPGAWDWPATATEEARVAIGRRKEGGSGFEIAHAALGSRVERHELSVYDLSPERVGTFDFVYVGSLLLHLRDPVRALEAVASVCRDTMLLVDAIDLPLTLRLPRRPVAALDGLARPWWWKPNRAGLLRMLASAGFDPVAPPRQVLMTPGAGQPRPGPRRAARALRHREGRTVVFRTWAGDPHLAVLARPAGATTT